MSTTATKERPILFSGPMVRAILDGRKTQTRRVVKGAPANSDAYVLGVHKGVWGIHEDVEKDGGVWRGQCPHGQPGERLWVRESFWMAQRYSYGTYPSGEPVEAGPPKSRMCHPIRYVADGDPPNTPNKSYPSGLRNGALAAPDPYAKWFKHPSIHLPRKLSRITLEITDVRVERLSEISEADAEAEGPTRKNCGQLGTELWSSAFRNLWIDINGHGSWKANPWVWAITFKRVVE